MKSLFKKICIASDHAGYNIKEYVKDFLIKKKISIIDLGPNSNGSVDYPDYAKKVAKRQRLAKAGIKCDMDSTRASEPVQSAAFKNGYRNS